MQQNQVLILIPIPADYALGSKSFKKDAYFFFTCDLWPFFILLTSCAVITRNLWNIKTTLLDSSYDFKQSNEHGAQQLCSVNNLTDPFHLMSDLISALIKTICFVTTSNTLKYCYKVVFLFQSFLVITVLGILSPCP